jgi:alpha-galactosidase
MLGVMTRAPSSPPFQPVTAEIRIDRDLARVYEHGWQSWSPTTAYAVTDAPHRPIDDRSQTVDYRAGVVAPADRFQGEGLLAVDTGQGGAVHIVASPPGAERVASIRAEVVGERIVISADGDVDVVEDAEGGLEAALGRWGRAYAAALSVPAIRPAPTTWCSWYYYWTRVSQDDVVENLDAMDATELPVDVVQLDDGYQAEIGDWLALSDRFSSVADLVSVIRDRGRRAGIWVAPFFVGERSQVRAEHPGWLVEGAAVSRAWEQDVFALDVTHPGAEAYLREVFTTLAGYGVDLFKLDFLHAGALEGRRHEDVPAVEAYRRGLQLIRDVVGPEAYLLGCGAPILPSVGLVDAMRVSPDIAPYYEPPHGAIAAPSQRAATVTGAGRAWQHGRFWVNDPDCILARPEMERREEWAAHVEAFGGLRGSSDRLRGLDAWGLETTRRLLTEVPPPTPFDEQG